VLSWETGRYRQSLPLLVSRAMAYSALPCFDESLMSAVKQFYGLEMDVATAEAEILEDADERIRFFPVAVVGLARSVPDEPTVGERFLHDQEHAPHERRLGRSAVRVVHRLVRGPSRTPPTTASPSATCRPASASTSTTTA
jgi:hypothetical protein